MGRFHSCISVEESDGRFPNHHPDPVVEENLEALEIGIENLKRHVENIKNRYGLNPIVAINRYQNDTEKELKFLSILF